jgi:restriction system protein
MSDATGARTDSVIWGIHAGATGDADSLFREQNVIAIGWDLIGDLRDLPPTREAFKAAVLAAYPDKPSAVPVNAGQVYRFVHEIRTGDVIAYPAKRDREVRLGIVTGDYEYAGTGAIYPNRRPVRWQKSVPRTHFSQGALHELGSAMSLFQVRNNAEEILDALHGKAARAPVTDDATVAETSEDAQLAAGDFILKRLAKEAKGHAFEGFVAALLTTMGYHTRGVPVGPDGGVDIIASRDELGVVPPLIKVQVKSTEGSVGDPVVSALYGKVNTGEFGLLVTLGTFTAQAKNFASGKGNLRLIDGGDLVDLVLAHYEDLDPVWKARLPLRRVWLPEPGD